MSKKRGQESQQEKKKQERERPPINVTEWLDVSGNIFVNPVSAFREIAAKEEWRLPVAMMSVAVILTTLQSLVPLIAPLREGQFISEQMRTVSEGFQNVIMSGILMGAMLQGIGWSLKALVFWGLCLAWRKPVRFLPVLAVTGLAWLPHFIQFLGLVLSIQADQIRLAHFFSSAIPVIPGLPPVINMVLAQFDIFILASLVLSVVGCAAISGLTARQQVFTGAIYWVLSSVVRIVFQAGVGGFGSGPGGM